MRIYADQYSVKYKFLFTKEFVCHLNLASADARPDDDVGELDQVQDVPLVTAQAHCLSLSLQFYSIVIRIFSRQTSKWWI